MRKLGPEEAALWARVAATIRPLHPQAVPTTTHAALAPPAPPLLKPRPASPPRPSVRAVTVPLAGKTLDSGWDKKLRNGSVTPDRVLDLHGLNLDSAWHAIDCALEAAIASGDRVLLLITGHARSGEPPLERGRIRAAVNDWLQVSRHSHRIASVRNAHRRHGGGGSLYIILRRDRRSSTVS